MNPSTRRRVQVALSLIILSVAIVLSYYSVEEVEEARPLGVLTDIYLVLDTSGSMVDPSDDSTKIEQAKRSANEFVDIIGPDLGANFTIGVISFSDQVTTLVHLTHDKSAIQNAIANLIADGRTAIGDALHRAVELLSQEGREGSRRVALLMSDGLSNADQISTPTDAADFAERSKVIVYTVAFGVDADQSLLRSLAQKTGGEYYYAGTGAELVQSFTSVAHSLLRLSAPAHYGSRILMLIALPLVIFLPQLERGIARTYHTVVTRIGRQRSVPTTLQPRPNICRRCGIPFRPNAAFCSRCGWAKDSAASSLTCKECGRPIRTDTHFCTRCGTAIRR